MPKPVHGYLPEGNSNAVPCRWVPAVHQTAGTQVLLYPFEPVGSSERADQLQQLQRTISTMGSPMLLSPFEADFSSQTPFLCVLQEDLHPLSCTEVSQLPMEQIDRLALNIARALDRLHLDGLLMGLLTPNNLLTRKPVAPDSVLLSGFAHVLDTSKLPTTRQQAYLSPHAAPELQAYMQAPSAGRGTRVTPACDVFSFGVLYHALLTNTLPTFSLSASSTTGHIEEPQLSRKLDYPHRQLLRRMMRLDPAERIPDMYEAEKEILRVLKSSGCMIQLTLPTLAGRTVSVRSGDVTCTWKRLDAQGCATFGPLMADQAYELTCQGDVIGEVHFPDPSSGQTATFGESQLKKLPPPEPSAPPQAASKSAEETARGSLQAELAAVLEQHLHQATAVPAKPAEAPQPAKKAEPAPVKPTDAPAPAKKTEPAPAKPADAPAPAKKTEPAPAKPADAPAPAKKTKPAPANPAVPSQPTKKAAVPTKKTPPAKKAAPAQVKAAESPKPARPAVRVLKRITLDPPLNNIRLIEMLSPELCQLTLINYGVFRIRTADAHRYGISHLIKEEGR